MRHSWFISDLHFGHKSILAFEKETRPFASKELIQAIELRKPIPKDLQYELENSLRIHNSYIVNKINSYVNPTDTLWILGDLAFGTKDNLKYVEQIVCRNKKLVLGNHDVFPMADYISAGFSKIFGMVRHKEFVLTHAPIHPEQLETRYKANIHGHLHDWDIEDSRYINVNMDRNKCTPITLEQIRDEMRYNEKYGNN